MPKPIRETGGNYRCLPLPTGLVSNRLSKKNCFFFFCASFFFSPRVVKPFWSSRATVWFQISFGVFGIAIRFYFDFKELFHIAYDCADIYRHSVTYLISSIPDTSAATDIKWTWFQESV